MNSSGTLKIARNGYIVIAVVFCALGIFLMAVPEKAVKIICVLAGILFLADGIIKIIGYFSRDFYCLAFQFDLAFGVLLAAVGVIIIMRRDVVVNLIFGIFGILILADALFKIQISIDAKKFGLNLWWRILAVAILTGVLGFLLLMRPFEAAEVMMILVGVALLFEGILNLCVAIYTVKIIKNQKQDIIDMDEY